MKLYYTNAPIFLGSQPDPDKSLGGLLSGTVVPNNLIGNIFGDISKYTIDKQLTETKAVVLKNETGAAVTDLKLWFDYPTGTQSKIEIAIVSLGTNSCDELYMETIANMRATPYVGTFVEADGVGNAIDIGDFAKDAYLGLWLRRSILDSAGNLSCDTLLIDYLANTPVVPKEDIVLQLSWT